MLISQLAYLQAHGDGLVGSLRRAMAPLTTASLPPEMDRLRKALAKAYPSHGLEKDKDMELLTQAKASLGPALHELYTTTSMLLDWKLAALSVLRSVCVDFSTLHFGVHPVLMGRFLQLFATYVKLHVLWATQVDVRGYLGLHGAIDDHAVESFVLSFAEHPWRALQTELKDEIAPKLGPLVWSAYEATAGSRDLLALRNQGCFDLEKAATGVLDHAAVYEHLIYHDAIDEYVVLTALTCPQELAQPRGMAAFDAVGSTLFGLVLAEDLTLSVHEVLADVAKLLDAKLKKPLRRIAKRATSTSGYRHADRRAFCIWSLSSVLHLLALDKALLGQLYPMVLAMAQVGRAEVQWYLVHAQQATPAHLKAKHHAKASFQDPRQLAQLIWLLQRTEAATQPSHLLVQMYYKRLLASTAVPDVPADAAVDPRVVEILAATRPFVLSMDDCDGSDQALDDFGANWAKVVVYWSCSGVTVDEPFVAAMHAIDANARRANLSWIAASLAHATDLGLLASYPSSLRSAFAWAIAQQPAMTPNIMHAVATHSRALATRLADDWRRGLEALLRSAFEQALALEVAQRDGATASGGRALQALPPLFVALQTSMVIGLTNATLDPSTLFGAAMSAVLTSLLRDMVTAMTPPRTMQTRLQVFTRCFARYDGTMASRLQYECAPSSSSSVEVTQHGNPRFVEAMARVYLRFLIALAPTDDGACGVPFVWLDDGYARRDGVVYRKPDGLDANDLATPLQLQALITIVGVGGCRVLQAAIRDFIGQHIAQLQHCLSLDRDALSEFGKSLLLAPKTAVKRMATLDKVTHHTAAIGHALHLHTSLDMALQAVALSQPPSRGRDAPDDVVAAVQSCAGDDDWTLLPLLLSAAMTSAYWKDPEAMHGARAVVSAQKLLLRVFRPSFIVPLPRHVSPAHALETFVFVLATTLLTLQPSMLAFIATFVADERSIDGAFLSAVVPPAVVVAGQNHLAAELTVHHGLRDETRVAS